MRTGLSDEIIDQLGDYETSDLAPSWIAALKLADHLSGDLEGQIEPELYAELREHFDDQQILMLGALLAVGSGWQRMIEAFGIRPNHYVDGQRGPWAAVAD